MRRPIINIAQLTIALIVEFIAVNVDLIDRLRNSQGMSVLCALSIVGIIAIIYKVYYRQRRQYVSNQRSLLWTFVNIICYYGILYLAILLHLLFLQPNKYTLCWYITTDSEYRLFFSITIVIVSLIGIMGEFFNDTGKDLSVFFMNYTTFNQLIASMKKSDEFQLSNIAPSEKKIQCVQQLLHCINNMTVSLDDNIALWKSEEVFQANLLKERGLVPLKLFFDSFAKSTRSDWGTFNRFIQGDSRLVDTYIAIQAYQYIKKDVV